MHYSDKNLAAIEKASKGENLLLVTETAKREAYKNEISLKIKQGISEFEQVARFESANYNPSVQILKDAEQRIKEAKERGYEVDFLAFKDGIKRIFEAVEGKFLGSRALLVYLNDSEFDLKKYKNMLEENLPQLAQKYANKLLKKSRRKAKNLRGTIKTKSNEMGKLERDLLCVAELKNYGIDEDVRISQIRNIAYERGVEFLVYEARKLAHVNKEKCERIFKRAKENAQILGREVPE